MNESLHAWSSAATEVEEGMYAEACPKTDRELLLAEATLDMNGKTRSQSSACSAHVKHQSAGLGTGFHVRAMAKG